MLGILAALVGEAGTQVTVARMLQVASYHLQEQVKKQTRIGRMNVYASLML